MTASVTERPFDLVLFGATGFTGKLVAEYLAEYADAGTRWAIAGRNRSKLEAVHAELSLPESVAILEVDSGDRGSLIAMVSQARVVCTTVGPYAQHGTALLEVCAEAGTHYCDLTGEVQWMAQMFERVNGPAQASGARLVHCCGFDSIPFDLGVFKVQQAFHDRHGMFSERVSGRMGKSRGGLSGGTAASMMLMLDQAMNDKEVRHALTDPYALYPPGVEPGIDGSDQMTPRWDPVFEQWTAPFLMAPCNTRVIRRSNALADFPYGTNFSYEESMLCGSRLKATAITGGMGGFMGVAMLSPGRALLRRVLPAPGTGPSESARAEGYFEYFAHAHHPDDTAGDVRVRVTGKRDPGYGATSRMLAQSALCLAHDPLSVAGGVWTTASALGDHLIQRLANVDVNFTVV